MAISPIEKEEGKDNWPSYFKQPWHMEFEIGIKKLCSEYLTCEDISSQTNIDFVRKKFSFMEVPEEGKEAADFLDELAEIIVAHSVNTGSPYFIGHMTAMLPNFLRPLSNMVTCLNQNQVKVETAKSMTFYEKQAIGMLHHAFYQKSDWFYRKSLTENESVLGTMTSGGTIANMTALQCARDASLLPYGDVEQEGYSQVFAKTGFERSVVICSELGHYSIKKALGLLGLGRENLLTVPVDKNQKMRTDELESLVNDCRQKNLHIIAIVAVAGTTECGSFDDISVVADIASAHNVHLHVDAAWGGAMIFSERHNYLLKGIDRADSITVDGHKQLYLPMGLGIVLFKAPELIQYIAMGANYIIRNNSFDLGRTSIEGSRPAMVLYLQAALQLLGKNGYGGIIEKNVETARNMARYIKVCFDFELLNHPQANIFLYRYIPEALQGKEHFTDEENRHIDAINIKIQEKQKDKGKGFVSRTTIARDNHCSVVGLRVVLANPLTDFSHCCRVLNEQREIVRGL